jgi:hypothetical protein
MDKKRSTEEGLRLIEEFERSGQTRRQFCEERKITVTTLDYWRWRKARPAKPGLVEVVVENDVAMVGFSVVLTNGRRIECRWNFRESELSSLIRIVESA